MNSSQQAAQTAHICTPVTSSQTSATDRMHRVCMARLASPDFAQPRNYQTVLDYLRAQQSQAAKTSHSNNVEG